MKKQFKLDSLTIILIAALIGTIFVLSSCNSDDNSPVALAPPTPTPTPAPAPAPAPPPVPTPQISLVLAPALTNLNLSYVLHGAASLAAPCVVTTTTGPGNDILCFLDVGELDLLANGLQYNYAEQGNMCAYVTHLPYYYFNMPAPPSPTTVTVNTTDGAVTSETNAVGGQAQCPFDYSKNVPAGPDCCEGEYTMTVVATTSATGAVVTTVSESQWGGKISNCLAGPAMATQPKDSIEGYPQPDLVEIGVSTAVVTKSYVVGPTNPLGSFNLDYANFFTPGLFTSGLPPSLDQDGNGIVDSNVHQNYSIVCRDEADEILARIQLIVRAWHKVPITFGGNPDAAGSSDFTSWDSIPNLYPNESLPLGGN